MKDPKLNLGKSLLGTSVFGTAGGTIGGGYLEGQLLIATPVVTGSCFAHSVVLMCAHTGEGAMGIIVNHIIENISYRDLFKQLKLSPALLSGDLPVYYGGPVEMNRGFVIHGHEGEPAEDALITHNGIAVSSSVNILREIAAGRGPAQRMLALGYAGWGPGQLEAEIEQNSWITVPSSTGLVFAPDNEDKWQRAAKSQGIDIHKLSTDVGHA